MFGSAITVVGLAGAPERGGAAEVGIGRHAGQVAGHPLPAAGGLDARVGLPEADPLVGLVSQAVKPAGDPQLVQVGYPGQVAGLALIGRVLCVGHRIGPGAGGGIDAVVVPGAGAVRDISILEEHRIARVAVGRDRPGQFNRRRQLAVTELDKVAEQRGTVVVVVVVLGNVNMVFDAIIVIRLAIVPRPIKWLASLGASSPEEVAGWFTVGVDLPGTGPGVSNIGFPENRTRDLHTGAVSGRCKVA